MCVLTWFLARPFGAVVGGSGKRQECAVVIMVVLSQVCVVVSCCSNVVGSVVAVVLRLSCSLPSRHMILPRIVSENLIATTSGAG